MISLGIVFIQSFVMLTRLFISIMGYMIRSVPFNFVYF